MKDFGFNFKAVFFLRADEQVRTACGAFSHVFNKFNDSISESFAVGWHPHLLRWSVRHEIWTQEFRDNHWIQEMLRDCHDDLRAQGFQVRYSKMGWCFHSNVSMKTLSDFGVEADFSALPSARSPGRLIENRSFQDRYDWSRTKPHPYHPNQQDYQSLGDLRILEIPQTTYEVRGIREFLFTMKTSLPFYRKLDFSYPPAFRRSVPVFLPNLINMRNLESFCESLVNENRKYITLYLHPSDLSSSNAQIVFENFLQELISVADRRSVKLSFADAQELSGLYASL